MFKKFVSAEQSGACVFIKTSAIVGVRAGNSPGSAAAKTCIIYCERGTQFWVAGSPEEVMVEAGLNT